MADVIDAKKKNRKVLRCSFTKSANELEKLLKIVPLRSSQVFVLWECLKTKYEELHAGDYAVYAHLLEEDATEEELLAEMKQSDIYQRKFVELRLQIDKLLEQPLEALEVRSTEESRGEFDNGPLKGKRKFQLPTIQFKLYDGNIRDWLGFWSQFNKIHEDSDIEACDKIEYLIQATVEGSRALKIVESFPSVGENYDKIIDCLKSRFGREDLQIEVYVRELLKLVLNNALSPGKHDLVHLYDQIETQLRALDTLGITSDRYAALLFPLIESCLPQELMRIWQRSTFNTSQDMLVSGSSSNLSAHSQSEEFSLEVRLRNLMRFLNSEVQNELRVDLASEGFGLADNVRKQSNSEKKNGRSFESKKTAAGLFNGDIEKCIFCSGSHESQSCFKAQKMSFDERKRILSDKKACFRCLKIGHQSRKCRMRLKCIICGSSHVPLMCQELPNKPREFKPSDEKVEQEKNHAMANQSLGTHVFLQTLRLPIKGSTGTRSVRGLIDSGSQRSYILRSTAVALNLKPKRSEKITHCLFGGTEVDNTHYCYDITVCRGQFKLTFEVLDQPCICNEVSTVFYGPWMQELKLANIDISDIEDSGPIQLLFGADVAGLLYTGKRHMLKSGLVAYETHFGWTIEGKVPSTNSFSMLSTISMLSNPSITELWQLDVLGISDPKARKSKEEMALAARKLFEETVKIDQEGRYEVRLPWLENHPPLPSNVEIARKRLTSTLKRLEKDMLTSRYNEVFKEWESAGIIEKIVMISGRTEGQGHFLPHRPVIKEGSTTAVRPVFDASARDRENPSLNQCLEKGQNLIELIPTLLIRFRENRIAVTADIKKAFLQVSVCPKDRHVLRFIWLDERGQEIVYQHNRVVFGVNCSPFLLGATIEYHLSKYLNMSSDGNNRYSKENIERLKRSFYVDNCVTSVTNEKALIQFIRESTQAMEEASFDLRGWEFSGNETNQKGGVPVLGLRWNPTKDVLTLNRDLLKIGRENVTKRNLLSVAQKIFDPIGFTCPATLRPKLWLQELWSRNVSWDTVIDDDMATLFKEWIQEVPNLSHIELPRWTEIGGASLEDVSLHTFVDASKDAYAAAIYCRVQEGDKVSVHLLAAKSSVAPIEKASKTITIPRLELLAATIGSRLYQQIAGDLSGKYESFFWSDSTTVISWIQRNEEWGTFVHNRIEEIRNLTPSENWQHIPGHRNPADLPSRGCSPTHLLKSRWWEGPDWLYQPKENWPVMKQFNVDEAEILREKKRTVKTLLAQDDCIDFHLDHFSDYPKIVRMMAWIFRFSHNSKKGEQKRSGDISFQEMDVAEKFIFKLIQKFTFPNLEEIKQLKPFLDEDGLLRLKTRVSNRLDTEDFRFPIILPAKHPVIRNLILHEHKKSCHIGVQGLLSLLRERWWIIGGRRAVRSIVRSCVICRRFNAKPFSVESPPLPMDRVRDAMCFEITGVDFTGPLYLKTGEKAWVCLFTCAVYRAVHLELTMSLSTCGFLQVFRRFIARRGRPKIIYSDNGTNFRGTENLFSKLDWEKILRETAIQRIEWRFNPPTASWWGGFFERLIGVVKGLLKRVLGSASLYFEDLMTLLCDCEAAVNERPLTYVSSDSNDLCALTPAMFLRDQANVQLPDCDVIEKTCLTRKMRNKQRLREHLRRRFRLEYLGQLKMLNEKKSSASVKLGQVVLIGNDFSKRIDWPIGRVIELIHSKDGQIRLVRVKTSSNELLRPVQRLYPLEYDDGEAVRDQEDVEVPTDEPELVTDSHHGVIEGEERYDSDSSGVNKSRAPDIDLSVERISRSGRKIKVPPKLLE